jgi:soluble lytic murein transglycosylase-like protein
MFKNEDTWTGAIAAAAAAAGVPVWVVKATIGKESSFNPKAIGPEKSIISRGLMQVTTDTARWLGYAGPVGDDVARTGGLYDAETSIRIGTHYLGYLARRFPAEPWDAIYAAYNSGAVRRKDGVLVTKKGESLEGVVTNWRKLASYFNPSWRAEVRVPFVPPA